VEHSHVSERICRCKRGPKEKGKLFCAQCREDYRKLWE
jgi:hypothetical protein